MICIVQLMSTLWYHDKTQIDRDRLSYEIIGCGLLNFSCLYLLPWLFNDEIAEFSTWTSYNTPGSIDEIKFNFVRLLCCFANTNLLFQYLQREQAIAKQIYNLMKHIDEIKIFVCVCVGGVGVCGVCVCVRLVC